MAVLRTRRSVAGVGLGGLAMGICRFRTHTVAGMVAAILIIPIGLAGPPAHAAGWACSPGMLSDFNGDGFSDAAVADPYATVGGRSQAGRVIVLYGDGDGRVGEGSRGTVSQDSPAVGGGAETGDRFGSALAVADLDCDGSTDLIVGTPMEDVSGHADSGLVQFIWGSAGGLGAGKPSQDITQSNLGGAIIAGDQFGYAVDALEDVGYDSSTGAGAYAVAIGVPGGNVDGRNDAGWAALLHRQDGGDEINVISQNSVGVPGSAEAGDRFGAALSMGLLLRDSSTIDLVVGVPGEDVGSVADAGAVTVVADVYNGEFPGSRDFHQNSPGVPGSAEAGDQFGRSLDTVWVDDTSRLAVGVPGEDVGRDSNAGAVQLFSSTTTTLTPGPSLTQDTPGVSGASEPGDLFGSQLTFVTPGDRATRLAVGVPSEDAAKINQGIVQLFPVSVLDAETTYGQDSAGVPGAVESGDEFGETLAFVDGASEQILIVGVPDDVGNRAGMVDVIPLGGGAPRAWIPGSGGVPLTGASRFGGALAGVHGDTA